VEEDWIQARETDGSVRDGAWVTELTELMPFSVWPDGTRLIMRRERPHPGAQLSVYSSADLGQAERTLNDRPRKTLDWRKPSERLTELIALTG